MNREISLTDIGPIKRLRFQVSETGGLYLLMGDQGTGKSTAIEAADALLNKRSEVSLPVRDARPSAEVSAFGATLRMGRRLSRLGELEIHGLEGRFDLADLVDPKIKEPLAADAKRIKALLQLSGQAEANPARFYPLVGGEDAFTEAVPKESLKTTDLVVLAGNVKRSFEKISRDQGESKTRDYAKAESIRLAVGDTDLKAPCDETTLQAAHTQAVRDDEQLNAKATAATNAAAARAKALEALANAKKEYKGLSVEVATSNLEAADIQVVAADGLVSRLREELAAAEKAAADYRSKSELAKAALQEATTYEAGVAALNSTIAEELPPEASLDDLEAAAQTVTIASQAMETGALVRRAKEQLKTVEQLKNDARDAELKEAIFRDAAKSTDTVLSQAVQQLQDCPLWVDGGRLKIKTDRGDELFQDLSKGEKALIAIRIAIKAVGLGGMVPVPQELFEGLSPHNRIAVAAEFENTGVVGLAAIATDDPELIVKEFLAFPVV